MMIRVVLFSICLGLNISQSIAQYDFNPVLTGLEGQDLLEELTSQFKPASVLNYNQARDSMFRNVYGVNDSLACVYTRHRVPMPPGADPTQVVFMGGAVGGLNTEHSWPRSYGAESGNPKSDMHHLFPTRTDVNSDRGVLPFLEIPDNQTNSWYFMGIEQGSIPNTNIDLYAERSGSAFEPPEDMKGNIARAIMYFKAIYPSQANQAPTNFFSSMQSTLCDWHYLDPVDSLEWHRTFKIATYQSGKPNPFVLDCTLATRAFCIQTPIACDPSVPVNEIVSASSFKIYPNPTAGAFKIELGANYDNDSQLEVFNSLGSRIYSQLIFADEKFVRINPSFSWAPGLYWISIRTNQGIIGTEPIFIK